MNDKRAVEFEATKESNFMINPGGGGGFRVSTFVQRDRIGLVLRTINTDIPNFNDLHLPNTLKEIAMTQRGLVIMVGATGSGKSTTLAAMIGHRNENSYGQIITPEDPVEYVDPHKKCIITQREIGVDTESWEVKLKNTLRHAPDVTLIGKIRDRQTMDYVITFAETGHLCLATLHANNANQALDRIINFFPDERGSQLLMDLSLNFKAVVSQRLVPLKTAKGRRVAIEIMLNSPLISDLIFKGNVHEIKEIMKKSRDLEMQTFDQALFNLYDADQISYEDTLRNAELVNDLRLVLNCTARMPLHRSCLLQPNTLRDNIAIKLMQVAP